MKTDAILAIIVRAAADVLYNIAEQMDRPDPLPASVRAEREGRGDSAGAGR